MKRRRRQLQSDDEEDEEEEEKYEAAKQKGRKAARVEAFFEQEAEVESDEDKARLSDEDDEDEDDEEQARQLRDEMIADDEDIENELAEAEAESEQKPKGESTRELVDDDYLLLEEHHGVKFRRKKAARREEDGGVSDKHRRRLRRQDEDEEEISHPPASGYSEDEYDLSEDEGGDGFIVDDIGGAYEETRDSTSGYGAAGDIFGDMSEFLQQERKMSIDSDEYQQAAEQDEASAQKLKRRVLDPSVAAKHFATEQDEVIRLTDVPERMQRRIAERQCSPGDPKDQLVAEAEWIHQSRFAARVPEEVIPAILHVLQFIRDEHLEVPYIQKYQKDYYSPLSEDDIWIVDECDTRWDRLVAKRIAIAKVLERSAEDDIELVMLAEAAVNEDEIDDIRVYVKDRLRARTVISSSDIGAIPNEIVTKRPATRIGAAGDIQSLVDQIFLKPRQLGENLRSQFLKHSPEDPDVSPLEVAATLVSDRYPDAEQVLAAARRFAAQQLSADPFTRAAIRVRFRDMAAICTEPTATGLTTIDWVHEYFPVKRLVNKPIGRFEVESSPQFVLLRKAESEGFIKSKFSIPRAAGVEDSSVVLDVIGLEFADLFVSQGCSSIAQSWNHQRRQIFQILLDKHLYPMAEKATRHRLLHNACDRVCELAADRLREIVSAAPLSSEHDRLVACAVGDRSEPTYVVAMNRNGIPIDHLVLHTMKTPGRRNAQAGRPAATRGDKKGSDSKLFREFVERHGATYVSVSASSMQSKNFMDEATKALVGIDVVLEFVDPAVAVVSMNAKHMTDAEIEPEISQRDSLYRYAVALGRFVLDPLVRLCSLAADDRDLLSLSLHPLQTSVPQSMLVTMLHRVLMSLTSSVGVNLNAAVAYPHLASPLRFVSGLGPRKAKHLVDGISRRGGVVISREEILERNLLGPVVYRNSIAFLRIIPPESASSGPSLHPLDDTRIHPELYVLSDRVVLNSLDADTDSSARCELVHELRLEGNLSRLEDLDLHAYAQVMEAEGEGRHNEALQLIKRELRVGYKDSRRPRVPPTPEEMFSLLTGEVPGVTIHVGQMVDAHVVRAVRFGLQCRLDSGLPSFVHLSDIDLDVNAYVRDASSRDGYEDVDDRDLPSFALRDKFRGGEALRCRIKMIDTARIRLEMTSLSRDIEDTAAWEIPPITDEYLVVTPEDQAALAAAAAGAAASEQQVRRKFMPRTIDHPNFANLDREGAQERLKERPIGDVIIRPSSSGLNFLTITWKCTDEIFVHVSVREFDKPNDVKQALGRKLTIGDETFDDLDEILERYIRPIASLSSKLTAHAKFRFGCQKEIDQLLMDEKEDNQKKIPYFLNANADHPGTFVLSFLPGRSPRHEPIRIVTDGYRFRKKLHVSISKLLDWFKRHALDEPKGAPSSSRRTHERTRRSSRFDERPSDMPPRRSRWGARPVPPSASSGYASTRS